MVMETQMGFFSKSKEALIINKCEVQKLGVSLRLLSHHELFLGCIGEKIDFNVKSELGPKDVA